MRNSAIIPILLATACIPSPGDGGALEPGPPPAAGEPAGSCDASRVQDLLGRPASAELGADAQRRSGARALRWIRPGDAVTRDYSPNRLNIELDAEERVTALSCG